MYFEVINCPVCGSPNHAIFLTVKYGDLKQKKSISYRNIGVNSDTRLYVKKCKNCNFVFVNPRVKSLYERLVYNESKKNMYEQKMSLDLERKKKSSYRLKKIEYLLPLIRVFQHVDLCKKELTLLDYGCGFGNSLAITGEFGINAYGIEIDDTRLAFCRAKGLNVSKPEHFLDTFSGIKADIIIMQSCIEHLVDIEKTLDFIKQISNTKAVLYVTGIHPRLIAIEKKRNVFVKAHFVEHINYFSFRTIDLLFSKYGFQRLPTIVLNPVKNVKDLCILCFVFQKREKNLRFFDVIYSPPILV